MRAWDFVRERIGRSERTPWTIPGGPSFAYVFGWVMVLLLGVEAVTGVALSAFYSPSTTSAWASVAYVQDQMPLGWLVRGLHHHGASAIVIVAGIHLIQTAVFGAYKKPRELTWWLGILLMLLVLVFAVSGYVLRWDQAGYWANRVELGIAAGTPVLGGAIRRLAIGGNDYGNLTLTRFHTLHVIVLPAVTTLGVVAHIALAKRHGTTTLREGEHVPRWPAQTLRDMIAMAVAFAILLGYTAATHGADLASPADPSATYDARPLWYFRWLFELRHLAGSWERFVALVVPALVAGFLIALPMLDRIKSRAPRRRLTWLSGVGWLFLMIGVLTMMSFAGDRGDAALAKRQAKDAELATSARKIARTYGVPAAGPAGLFSAMPMSNARKLYGTRCKSCHDAQSKDRKGPIIGPGHGDRAWLKGFLLHPSGDAYWGKTKLGPTDNAMKPVELQPDELSDLIEALYAQSGAADVDSARRDRGKAIFDKACTDCHSMEEDVAGTSAPALFGLGSRTYYTSFIGNAKSPLHMTKDNSEMPRLDNELTIIERDEIAGYVEWLRTHTQADLDALSAL